MRAIYLAQLDKPRPVVILTRESVVVFRRKVTVAPITSTIRGGPAELAVGPDNGLDHPCVINFDNISTIDVTDLGQQVGFLLENQEEDLIRAIHAAFDLDD